MSVLFNYKAQRGGRIERDTSTDPPSYTVTFGRVTPDFRFIPDMDLKPVTGLTPRDADAVARQYANTGSTPSPR